MSAVSYNDFVIKFANVNGSGSASANGLFAKALFRMGIPVGLRNIFPSNIEGLPTWFEVRVSEQGYLGPRSCWRSSMISSSGSSSRTSSTLACFQRCSTLTSRYSPPW